MSITVRIGIIIMYTAILFSAGSVLLGTEVMEHARRALAAQQPQTVVYLLDGRVDPDTAAYDEARFLLAEARFALHQHEPAISLLAIDGGFPGPWPAAWQGRAAQLRAHIALARDENDRARTMLINALEAPGHAVDAVACLVLLADLVDDPALRQQCLQRAWRGWDGSPWRARAGLMLADDALRAGDTALVRTIATELRIAPHVPAELRERALLLLLRVLVESRPVAALDLIRSELMGAASDSALQGILLVYRVAALAGVDPAAALWHRQALPASVHDHPIIRAVDPALNAYKNQKGVSQTDVLDSGVVRERARALFDLDRDSEALALLAPLAGDDPKALYLMLVVAEDDPTAWERQPVATTPDGALVLAAAWQSRGDEERALETLRAVAEDLDWPDAARLDADPSMARLALRAAQLTRSRDTGLHRRLAGALRNMTRDGWESGTAWAWHAQDEAAESTLSWAEAVRRLPPDHPWLNEAAMRAARPLLATVPPGHVLEAPSIERQKQLQKAVVLLSRAVRAGNDHDQHRSRFLLVQALAQLGRRDEALACMEPLWTVADEPRRAVLEACRQRLLDRSQDGQ